MAFDDDREIEGELYKLNMSLDHLEHAVQENLKQKMVRCETVVPNQTGWFRLCILQIIRMFQ